MKSCRTVKESDSVSDSKDSTAKRHVVLQANMCWHGRTASHSAKYSFPNAELSLHNLNIFQKFMKQTVNRWIVYREIAQPLC